MKGYLSPSLGKPEARLACLGPPLVALDRQGWLQMGEGKNGGKAEATFQVPPYKGRLEMAENFERLYLSF
jgi:hypothetical protein